MLLWPVGYGCCMLCKGMARSVDEGRRVTSDGVPGAHSGEWAVLFIVMTV